ncbi:hypothetical protein C9374_004566 [Naegleria lovaniensis]|uniref:Thioredoxin domain-containing protein n=1 Tax=Naegleria lovaniensis TaxID=51637 RepID=A0AA88GQC6_NAELO|nr:uncharacterized protein C9374_004566 [Naegleria lovaniensis]KAG2383229.1 hypothetical protein C9374_004566 [Naegleria lovaniensis]
MRKKPQEKSFQTTYENVQEWEKALLHNQNTPNHVLVVDVHASWCGKCQSILPVFEKINLEYADEHPLAFGVLDSEKILSELHDLMKPVPRQLGVPSMQLRGSSKNLLVLGDHEVLSDELKKKKLYKEDVKRKNYKATLESCVGLSEPHFLIFKEGELMRKVRGVNTPSLQRFIIQLLTNEGTEKKEEQHENVSEIKTIQIEEPKQEVVIEVKQEETKPTEVNSTETSESAPKEKPSESSKNDTTEEQKQESSKEAHPSEDESMKLSQDEKPQDSQTAETNVEVDSKPTETTSEVTLNAHEERQQMDVNTQETSMNDLSSDRKSIEAVPQETSKNESLQQEQPLEPTEETKTEVKLETPSQEKRQAEEIPTRHHNKSNNKNRLKWKLTRISTRMKC